MTPVFGELLPEMFSRTQLLYLDFGAIPKSTPPDENIQIYFEESEANGIDPKLPENRQRFNDRVLAKTGKRYLLSRYGEDRSAMLAGSQIAAEGRTLHMGVDIFCSRIEPVWSPCDGEVVRVGREPGSHGYGNYLIFKPKSTDFYLFLGHLGPTIPHMGNVKAKTHIAQLGNYKNNENGGWSRHLHLQIMTKLVPEGRTPIGYSTKGNFAKNSQLYPSPLSLFPGWRVS